MECGQRLIPKTPNAQTTANILPAANLPQPNLNNSAKLHSPMLDINEQADNNRNRPLNKPLGFEDVKTRTVNSGPSNSIARNNLHSPLLDGQNNPSRSNLHSPFLDGQNNPAHNNSQSPFLGGQNSISHNNLHSPLLDGQNHFVNPYPDKTEDYDDVPNIQSKPVSQNHIEKSRLHSPVLDGPSSSSFSASYIEETHSQEEEYESLRSPLLQAKVPLPAKNEVVENPTGQGNRLGALLGAATAQPSKAMPNKPDNIERKESFVAPLSITGINKLTQANKNSPSKTKLEKLSGANSLLPSDEEIAPAPIFSNKQSKSSLNKTFLISLIFLALGFKFWYLLSLGSAVFGSIPFAFDQLGQIIVLLSMLVLVLS